MPEIDKLHEHARRLAELTSPGKQEPGLFTWCKAVGEEWGEIARMWAWEPPSEIAQLRAQLAAAKEEHEAIIGNLALSLFPNSPPDSARAEFMLDAMGACQVIDRIKADRQRLTTELAATRARFDSQGEPNAR